ncbi:MAG: hypothetical protein PVG22_08175 [Chromatiales bacterium]
MMKRRFERFDVRLYNSVWSQWGNWLDLPTVIGDTLVAGGFEL